MKKLNKKLLLKFDKIEREREKLFLFGDSIDDDTLLKKPAPDKWSIIQIIFHIVKAEHLTLITIQNNLKEGANPGKAGIRAKISSLILTWGLRSPVKVKSPEILSKMPDRYDLTELKNKWIKIRNKLNRVLNEISSDDARKNLFKHPHAGDLNIFQALDFIEEHFTHHKKQIEKIIRANTK